MNKLALQSETAVALPERDTMLILHLNFSNVIANSAAFASSSGVVSIGNTVESAAGATVNVVQL